MAIIPGNRATGATLGINADRLIVEMHPKVMQLDGEFAPLTVLMAKISKSSVGRSVFNILEDDKIPTLDRVNNGAGYTAAAVTITVDAGANHGNNSFVRVQRTGEVMYVSSVTGNDLTVQRSWGATAAAPLVDNDQLQLVGGGAREGADAEAARSLQTTTNTNFLQIIRFGTNLTGTLIASNVYGEKPLPYQRKKALVEWKTLAEMALLFGEKNEDLTGNEPRRTTGGVDAFVATNITDFGGGFNLATFDSFAKNVTRHGDQTKMLFVGRDVHGKITLEALNSMRLTQKESSFGMKTMRLETAHGAFIIVPHKLMEGDFYRKRGLAVDMGRVGYRYLQTRDVRLKTNIQANRADGQEDEWTGEVGLWIANERTHGRMENAA